MLLAKPISLPPLSAARPAKAPTGLGKKTAQPLQLLLVLGVKDSESSPVAPGRKDRAKVFKIYLRLTLIIAIGLNSFSCQLSIISATQNPVDTQCSDFLLGTIII